MIIPRFRTVSLFFLMVTLAGCGGGGNTPTGSTGGSGGSGGSGGAGGSGGGNSFQPRPFPGDFYVLNPDTPTGSGNPTFQVVYDSTLNEFFTNNSNMNEVRAYSSADGHFVGAVHVPEPVGLSISPDGSQMAVGTGTPHIYFVNPATLHITGQVEVPTTVLDPAAGMEPELPFLMASGPMLIGATSGVGQGTLLSYDPTTGVFAQANAPGATIGLYSSFGATPVRSLDGNYLAVPLDSGMAVYSAESQTYIGTTAGEGALDGVAANPDGSQFVTVGEPANSGTATETSITFWNRSLQQQSQYLAQNLARYSNVVYSRDGKYLYLRGVSNILALDTQTGLPAGYQGLAFDDFFTGNLWDTDSSNRVYGTIGAGAFVASVAQLQPTAPAMPQFTEISSMAPDEGPLSGGTQVQLTLNSTPPMGLFSSTAEAYFGTTPATNDVASQASLTATAPASTAGGPVTVLMTDANNNAILLPGAYSYGPHVHWIDPSVASTKGNVDSTMLTDGIELGDLYTRPTVTIGGNSAATEPGNSAATEPLGGHEVQVTLPGGNPGWADLTITLPDGTSETTKNMVQNLAQYATLTSPIYTSAVYDSTRDLFYLAGAGSGVGVFSPETQTFLQPMQASFVTSNAVLSSLAITPDNSKLLASDPEDQKVLVFDLTNGTSTAVSVLWGTPQGPITAPMPVATISGDRALVIVTSWWEYDSPQMQSNVEELDLSQMTMQIRTDVESAGVFSVPPWMIASSADGSVALLGAEVNSDQHSPSYAWRYDAASDAFSTPMTYSSAGGDIVAVDGDGTVLNVGGTSVDQNLLPLVPNLSLGTAGLLTETGALYYTVGSQVGISDSRNGATLLLLPIFPYQGGSGDMAGAFAIDPTGQKILVGFGPSLYYYELAVVPLAVGTVSPAVATPGTSLTIRGDGFVAGTTVNIAGQISTCTMIDNETLQCVVPDVSAGLEPMTLSNPDGQTYSLEAAVNVQ